MQMDPFGRSQGSSLFGKRSGRSNSELSNYVPPWEKAGQPEEELELEGQITREMFEAAMGDPKTEEILDDLDVQMADRMELFDVLDADGSGAIDIGELIAGLMKMRSGGADKSDSVAT